jgi:hypothetical protein
VSPTYDKSRVSWHSACWCGRPPTIKTLKTLSIARTLACIGRTYAVAIFVNPLNGSIPNNPHMKHKFLLSLSLICALACLALFADRASAIAITTTAIPGNDIPLRSVVQVTPPGTVDELGFPIGVERFSPIETSASQPNLLANQTLRMMNGGNAATIRGKGDIVNNAVQVGDFTTTAQSESFLSFTLTEPVNFTLDIDFSGTSTPGSRGSPRDSYL